MGQLPTDGSTLPDGSVGPDGARLDIVNPTDGPRTDSPVVDIPRVGCRVNGDCPAAARFCNPRTMMCVQCLGAVDCASMGPDAGVRTDGGLPPPPGNTQCSLATNTCVQCNTTADCPMGFTCSSNSCQCQPDTNGASCAAATSGGTIMLGTNRVLPGNLTPMSTEDWFSFAFAEGPGARARIELQAEPGSSIVMQVRTACGSSGFATCTDRPSGADGVTTFEFDDSMMMGMAMMPTRMTPWPAMVFVRVYASRAVTACVRYQLSVSN